MPLDVGEALRTGFNRTLKRNGFTLAAAYFLVGMANTALANTFVLGLSRNYGLTMTGSPGFTLPVSLGAASVLWLVTWIFSFIVGIAAIRTFVSSETRKVPKEFYTRNMGMAVLNLLLGSIVFGLIVGAGFLFFVIPGIFLMVSLIFWNIYVIVEDQNFIEGLKNSWNLTKGNRLDVFLLGLAVIVVSLVVSFVFGLPKTMGINSIGAVIMQLGSAAVSVFATATLAAAYNQLTE